MNDRLEFSIDGVKRAAEEMRESNSLNKKNKANTNNKEQDNDWDDI